MSLFDTSTKATRFANIGNSVTGQIAGVPYQRQKTKFGTNQPDFYDNGDPKMQILVPLTTEPRENPADDGTRTLYVSSAAMKRAIATAIRDVGADDLEIGGSLTVTFTGFDANSKNPANPAKLYTATYTRPESSDASTQPVMASPADATVPFDEGKVRELIALGLDDEQIAAALGMDVAGVQAVRANLTQQ